MTIIIDRTFKVSINIIIISVYNFIHILFCVFISKPLVTNTIWKCQGSSEL